MSNAGSRLQDFEARLRALADDVRAGLPERAEAVREAGARAAQGEAEAIAELARLAHRLAGIAGSHGLEGLGAIARRLESEARAGHMASAVQLAGQLADAAEAAAGAAAPPAAEPTRADAEVPRAGPRVLVVDDDPDALRLLGLMLGRVGGYQVTTVSHAADAIEHVRAGGIDLIVADAMMSEIDGLELCRRARAELAPGRLPPVVMLSASTAEDLGWQEAPDGPDHWLMKPVDRATLLRTVRRLLGERERVSTR